MAQRQRRHSSFILDALVVIKVNVIVNQFVRFMECLWFVPVDALCFQDGEEILGHCVVNKGPGGKFCVSVFRQNQEYHIINVHDGAYSPWLHPSRKVGAVCAPRAA